ncbi:hypothetical protein Tco_0290099 [Tanacetum coccineum]
MSNKSETDSEISLSVFEVRSSDEEITPANDRFSKADRYHAVPPHIIRNFLTPRADISFAGLDEYGIRKKIIKSKTTELNIDTSKSKTSENVGKTKEVNIEKPKLIHESVVSKPMINRDKVIIKDWNSDDEDDVFEVNTVSPVKTNKTQTVKTQVDKIGQISQKEGIRFKKIKACFVCKSTDHLIKDCDFYAKKSPEPKLKIMVNTGQRVVKPVWDNAKRVNHQKKLKYPQARRTFVPSGVLTRTGLVNPVTPNGKRAVHIISTARPVSTARPFALKIAQTGSAIRPIYPRMDNVRPKASYSPIKRSYYTKPAFRPKNLKQDVKTSRVKNMTTAETRAVVNTGKGKMNNDLKKSRWIMKITIEALWLLEVIPKDSPFELEAFSDSDYRGASLDKKSTTGGCQFLGRRLISWQCKKQTIVANSTTEAEYVAAANCCGQVLWIQNQMMDYGFNFMNTKIHIDNESTICIVKNPVYHSRTKHIEIRHHFIRDCYEKRLIDVIKIHTDANVADLLTKGFDVTRFNFLVLVSAASLVNTARPTHSTARLGEHIPLLPAMLAGATPDQGEGSAIPAGSQPTPDPVPSITVTEIPHSHGSYEAPLLEGNASGSAEDSLNLKELMDIVPKLVLRIDNLEKELHAVKERLNSAQVEVNTKVNLGTAGVDTGNTQSKGRKSTNDSEDVQATQKTKEQIRQEEAGLAEAMRLQDLQDEEDARQVHLDALLAKRIQEEQELSEQQQKRKAEVQEAAQFYTEED